MKTEGPLHPIAAALRFASYASRASCRRSYRSYRSFSDPYYSASGRFVADVLVADSAAAGRWIDSAARVDLVVDSLAAAEEA